jgi:hypothetical protein
MGFVCRWKMGATGKAVAVSITVAGTGIGRVTLRARFVAEQFVGIGHSYSS